MVTIYTDGACKGNPGQGGWGAILLYNNISKEIYGYEAETTNNRMELMAVIRALSLLNKSCDVILYTDSKYVQKGMSEWIENWIKKNWKNVKNVDLWQQIYKLAKQHKITWQWVKAHNGNALNERADYLANLAIIEKIST
jgi:ribonuclease HI